MVKNPAFSRFGCSGASAEDFGWRSGDWEMPTEDFGRRSRGWEMPAEDFG
jgi:hypothetical protein